MGRVRRGARAAVATVLLAGGLAGCVGPFAAREKEPAGPVAASGAQRGAGPVSVVDPAKVIAEATFDSPQAPGAKLRVGVVSLKAGGRLANLTLVLTPNVPGVTETSVYRLVGGHAPDVSLIDTVNLKRHVVVKDSEGHQLQPDYIFPKIANGQSMVQNYTFAAPPENVRTVEVHFGPFAPFRDVPVER